jgi:hypothetical protein
MKPQAATWPYNSWPERRVVRVGVSPMNPKVRWAELDCGHDESYLPGKRRPKVGATTICEKCAAKAGRK